MITKDLGRIAPRILRDHGKGLGVVPGLPGPRGGGPAPAARQGAQFRRELPEAMVPAPAVLWPSLLPATQPRLPLPQPPLRAGWVHEPCSRQDRGHQRSRHCPRRSSRPGWDMPSRLILQLQIVPAHNRSDLAYLVLLCLTRSSCRVRISTTPGRAKTRWLPRPPTSLKPSASNRTTRSEAHIGHRTSDDPVEQPRGFHPPDRNGRVRHHSARGDAARATDVVNGTRASYERLQPTTARAGTAP